MTENVKWGQRAKKGFLGSGIDPADRRGNKNYYIDLLQKTALEEALGLRGDELVLDFGCGSGRFSYWIAPRVKRVVGLEVTPEMIELAEKNRTEINVKFMLYDGVEIPAFPYSFDIILSVGVLQTLKGGLLRTSLSGLARCLKRDGKLYFIEQASDNPKIGRPKVEEYLQVFEEAGLECLRHNPVRNGRWWMLYFIRYGVIPRGLFSAIAKREILLRQKEVKTIPYYQDYLFVLRKS